MPAGSFLPLVRGASRSIAVVPRVFTVAFGCAVLVASLGQSGNSLEAIARPVNYASSAVQAAFAGRYIDAQAMATASGNSAAEKLVEWIYLRQETGSAGHERLIAFVLANPDWPGLDRLRTERMRHGKAPGWSEAQVAKQNPQTLRGMLDLARSCLVRDERENAQEWVAQAWRKLGSDPTIERRVLQEFGSLLSVDDHKQRLWRLIYAGETNAAIRAAKLLPTEYQQTAKVAQQLVRGKSGALQSFEHLSLALRAEMAMQYALARYYRQTEQYDRAAAILLEITSDTSDSLDPTPLWNEIESVARELLGRSDPAHWQTSYALVALHGPERGTDAAEAEFLAGWIALRFLRDGERALPHFQRLQGIVTTQTERARAAYWLARTYEYLGKSSAAYASYIEAARIPTVYYGQLAREAIGQGNFPIIIPEVKPSLEIRTRTARDELVRAYRVLAAINRPVERRAFLESLTDHFRTSEEMAAVAGIVWSIEGPYETLQLAKSASAKGIDIDNWSYPIEALPSWKQIGSPVEDALLFGVARQESEFNPQAQSPVGARGLMQLMPDTARLLAIQNQITYDERLLTTDPSYNVTLGAALLSDLVNRFRGSYVLALAAYNASPSRASEWIKKFGDPRDSKIDPIDWIESIPFAETRFYIQKALQNTQVYRSQLRESGSQGILADLSRGRSTLVAQISTSPPEVCESRSKIIDPIVLSCW